MASRYSVSQSASVAGSTDPAGARAWFRRSRARHSRPRAGPRPGRARPRRQWPVHQNGFRGAADAGPTHLGVQGHRASLGQVGGGVNVGVADALQVLEQRHPAFGGDTLDQRLAAARHDDIDKFAQPQQRADGFAVAGGHHLAGIGRQAGGVQAVLDAAQNGAGGAQAFRAAAQNDGVAGLQAQGGGVGGDVGAAFIDHADDAQRHPHAGDAQTVGAIPCGQFGADRVGQSGHLTQPLGHGGDALVGQAQTVDQGRGQAVGLGLRDVLGVGGLDGVDLGHQGVGGGGQDRILGGRGRGRQHARGGAGASAHGLHQGGNVGGVGGGRVQRVHDAVSLAGVVCTVRRCSAFWP